MRVAFEGGVTIPDAGWRLDPRRPARFAFVSHAHFDHMARHSEWVCSEGTAALMRVRLPSAFKEGVCHAVPFGERRTRERCEFELWPAGHVLGSAMLWLSDGGESVLYTGDFKLRAGLSSERCEPRGADVLVMETTYGLPGYVFPPASETIRGMVAFCGGAVADGGTAVVFGYSLGKAQEAMCALAGAGLPVRVHVSIAAIARVYAERGVKFPEYGVFDGTARRGEVLVLPPGMMRSQTVARIPKRRTAAVTGWAMDPAFRFRSGCDEGFVLSDHADYGELLELVERVQPRRVYTVHGYAAEFAAALRRRGVEAWALERDNQLEWPALIPGDAGPPARGR
jgi:Cft2 family RNA processing exonuclease